MSLSVDILINNAGIGFQAGFEKRELQDWEQTVSVNVCALVGL